MYSKSYILLFFANIVCALLIVFSRGIEVKADSSNLTRSVKLERFASLERVITYDTIEQSYCIRATEAGGEDRRGKLLVANVVINRVKSSKFPDNITDVVFQRKKNVTQFSPVANGTIYRVKVSEETREAVYSALYGEDVSEGALFFMARKYANPENAQWFDSNLVYLFSYGGHDFFKR